MPMTDLARAAAGLLSGYYGRDSIVRVCSYGAMALSGAVGGKSKTKFLTISEQLSATRTILRLFDDLPMLLHNLSYRLGEQEESLGARVFGSLTNLLYQCYFPVEHIAWAGDKKLIDIKSGPWWVLGLLIWAAALISSIFKAIIQVLQTKKKIQNLRREAKDALLSGDNESGPQTHVKQSLKALKQQQFADVLSVIKNGADLMNAVNWLPAGMLWAHKFSAAQSGIFGTISSIIIVWENFMLMKMKEAKMKKSA